MHWYYAVEGRAAGPVSEEELTKLMWAGEVKAHTLVWHPGLELWEPVMRLKPALLTAEPPPSVAAVKEAEVGTKEAAAGSGGLFGRLFGRRKNG